MTKIIPITLMLMAANIANIIAAPVDTVALPSGELVPAKISLPKKLNHICSCDHSKYGKSLPSEFRTFAVTPSYRTLPEGGVEFNIEDVSATDNDMNMTKISLQEYKKKGALEANLFYEDLAENNDRKSRHSKTEQELLQGMEVFSEMPDNLVYAGADGFLAASIIAFSRHLPLTLKPDHIWMLIINAVSQHVNEHSEELRNKFVSHEGKKDIIIDAPSLIKGKTPASVWEETVFAQFSEKIKDNLNSKELQEIITSKFSVTTTTEKSCREIILMSMTRKYFNFICYTLCGIPQIRLLGSEQDWQLLLYRTEKLLEYVTTDFKDFWLPKLKPVLEKFIDSYKGNIDYTFWQTMVKLRRNAYGSGAYNFISGWIQIFYPYQTSGILNKNMKPWDQCYFSGPKIPNLPDIMSSVPVLWKYVDGDYKMHYHAGVVGFSQNPENGSLMPVTGWRISYDRSQKK